jgi:threonylcarbamoyladenosine tRNA methylthiotransferase MtaB
MTEVSKNINVALDSLGCKLNQAEMQQLAAQFVRAGYRLVDSPEKADIYVLNTCTVTHVADRKSRHLLRLARRRHPLIRLVALGCYAHRAPHELKQIEGVDLVINNEQKNGLVSILVNTYGIKQPHPAVLFNQPANRNRAFLRVQDGCRNFCAFCIVPYVRTREESLPVLDIIHDVKEKVAAGFNEAVLTGTEIGAYRHDGTDLAGLIERILDGTSVTRLRLSSLQPHHISPGFLKLWADPRLCPHFHLSLQSGSDAVLKRMRRRYTVADYLRTVTLIRDNVTDVAITTDVIVGFPGETDAEFQETLGFCGEMAFARIHVFPFSPRPGTAAAAMPGQIPDAVKKERASKMLAIAEKTSMAFRQGFLGRTMTVLWEQRSGGVWSGLTGNYIRVYTRSRGNLSSKLSPVELVKIYRDGVWGEINHARPVLVPGEYPR